MYFESEKRLLLQLKYLKKNFNLQGIKAEYEAEGSSYQEVSFLRRLTYKANVPLHIKIGGGEALNDIYSCIELGVDGIIAPMVETKFGRANPQLYFFNHISINFEESLIK